MLSPLNIVSLDQGKLYGQKPNAEEFRQRPMEDIGLAHHGSLPVEGGLARGQAASWRVAARFSLFIETVTAFARRLQPMS